MKVYINETKSPNPELIKELEALNISINTTYIFVLSIFITLKFLYSEKTRVIDEINGTTYTNNLPNLSHLPLLSNRLAILGLAIAIKTNLNALNYLLSLDDSEENRTAIKNSKTSLLASVLGYIAAGISSGTLLTPSILEFNNIFI